MSIAGSIALPFSLYVLHEDSIFFFISRQSVKCREEVGGREIKREEKMKREVETASSRTLLFAVER